MRKTIISVLCVLALILCCSYAMAAPITPTPVPPMETPAPAELDPLQFEITVPGSANPIIVTYAEIQSGAYRNKLPKDLPVGIYTVKEINPGKLLNDFSYVTPNPNDPEDKNKYYSTASVVSLEVTATETKFIFRNVYETALPTAEPTPFPKDGIPVMKVWEDNGDVEGRRPQDVTVHLLANGKVIDTVKLNAANGWYYVFPAQPKLDGNGQPIKYTVTEDPVPGYRTEINGTTIRNIYVPRTMAVSVMKVWDDEENKWGLRPASIVCTLSNGMSVTLNEKNKWFATISNLPIGNYTWTEQEIPGYRQTATETFGTTTVFTNTVVGNPPKPQRPGEPVSIEEYNVALGVDVIINHVGDCFD